MRKALLSAMPVTMPGSAIGRMISSETTLRPKKRVRRSASAAQRAEHQRDRGRQQRDLDADQQRVPGAGAVRGDASTSARVSPLGGQANVRSTLNELTTTSASGT